MDVSFDVPDTVWQSTSTRTCNLLLLEAPLRKLDLVREQYAASHHVDEPELGLDGSETLLCLLSVGLLLDNLNTEQVVRVSLKSLITVGRDFVLPVSLCDRGTDIVRVKTAISGDVVEPDYTTILNVDRTIVIPSFRASQVRASVVLGHNGESLVLHDPDVVLVLVGVESNLLLLAAGGVHVAVRVEVSTLCVPVTEGNAASVGDIGWHILHTLGVQGGLELRGHETITFAGVDQADEVDCEHGHVERDGNDDQTEETGEEVLEPQTRGDSPCVSKQNPELQERQGADPCDCEESNPFYASCSSQTKTSSCQPEPPCGLEGLLGALLVLVCKGSPGECGECREDDQGRIEKDKTRLSNKRIVCVL